MMIGSDTIELQLRIQFTGGIKSVDKEKRLTSLMQRGNVIETNEHTGDFREP